MNVSLAISVGRSFQKCFGNLEMINVQAGAAFRGIPTVKDELLELLTASRGCELLWITWCCCEAHEWVLTTRVYWWDWMSNQEGGWDWDFYRTCLKNEKGECWNVSIFTGNTCISHSIHYSCENQVSWYTLQVFVKYMTKCRIHILHAELQRFSLLLLECV